MPKPETPLLTVDIIIEVDAPGASPSMGIVLIERKHPPLGWALPGGFVDRGESLSHAAVREAREETSLDVTLTEQFFAYSDPGRDTRGSTVTVVFIGRASGEPRGADDAKKASIYPLDKLPPLAFDHPQIVADYLRYKQTGERPPVLR